MKNSIRKSAAWFLVLAVGVAPLIGCKGPASTTTTSGTGPAWIDQPNQYDDGETKALYAVGIGNYNPNVRAQRNSASASARAELAKSLRLQVQGLVQDYMNTNRDFYDLDGASSVEYYEEISNQVTNETLVGSYQIDSWKDGADKTLYVLYRLDLDSVFASYRDNMEKSFEREVQRKRIKVQKDDFDAKLKEQIEATEQMKLEQIRALSGDGA